jgi:hypothetical protein
MDKFRFERKQKEYIFSSKKASDYFPVRLTMVGISSETDFATDCSE